MLTRTLLAIGMLLSTGASLACSCMPLSGKPEQDVRLFWAPSSVVVSAIAEAVTQRVERDLGYDYDRTHQRITWRVTRKWKGSHEIGESFSTDTETTCCLCGVSAVAGDEWLLYLQRAEPYSISECSLSAPLDRAGAHLPVLDELLQLSGDET